MLRYRNDIEGLRAVAVIPILLFHAGVSILRGGYTGVDIFFVISGFLITQIIIGDIEKERFSILRFYQRRVARILPALFFLFLIVGLVAGPILVLPTEIARFFESLAAGAGFASNIYFWSETGYFAAAAESMPLLHTWSLGVEEQFYIFFPLLLYALRGVSRPVLVAVLAAIALVSLGAGVIVQRADPVVDFYWLPFRAWELIIGSLIAVGAAPKLGPRLSQMAALGGIALITASIFFMVKWLPFPSPAALVPVIGTALLIAYGENTWVGRALTLRPLRWIGLISFSLYLWHWPIIVFYRELTGSDLTLIETAALLAASIAAAAVSYYLVENPLRERLRTVSPGRAVAIGAGATVAVIALALTLAFNASRIWPVDQRVEEIARYVDYKSFPQPPSEEEADRCFVQSSTDLHDTEFCLTPVKGKRNVLLFGDSHASMYSVALREAFPDVNWMEATHFGCPPLTQTWTVPTCTALNRKVLKGLLPSGEIDAVVLASRWRHNQAGTLKETIALFQAQGVDVTIIGPVPEYQGALPVLLAKGVAAGNPDRVQGLRDPKKAGIDAKIRKIAEASGARYRSVQDTLCKDEVCQFYTKDGGPIAFDYGHLTSPGARIVVGTLEVP